MLTTTSCASAPKTLSPVQFGAGTCASRGVKRCATQTEAPKAVEERQSLSIPEWVPEQASPAISFLDSTDFKLQNWKFYQDKIAKYAEDPAYQQLVGWKAVPEIINGRLSMLGFVVAAVSEVFGSGPVAAQIAAAPQAILVSSLLIVAASCIPPVKGTQEEYVEAVRDTYSIPEGVFTEAMERVHARLAMLGLFGLVTLELVLGRALL